MALGSVGAGVWDMDLAARTVLWSPTAAAVLDRPVEALGNDALGWLRFVVEEDRAALRAAVEQSMTTGEGLSAEFRIDRADGEVASLMMIGEPGGAGRRHLVGIITDASRQRDLEARNRYADRLEAVGTIARAVAHAFNNSLTVIAGHARLLMDDLADGDMRRDVGQIAAAAERARALAAQLLAFGRRPRPGASPLDVNTAVLNLSESLRALSGEEVSLEIQLAPAVDPVDLTREQLEALLANLVTNARDATCPGGKIVIQTANTTVDRQVTLDGRTIPAGPAVSLRVSDDGHGMSEETGRRMFEPFYTTRGADDRAGLGMARVMATLRDARGTLAVDTELVRGTTLTVYLPRLEPAAMPIDQHTPIAVRSAGASPEPRGTSSVLLVDDDRSVTYFARVVLERAGYKVVTASEPIEAARLFRSAHASGDTIAVVVTDILLADRSGPELAAALRQLDPSLGVVYMSGNSRDPRLGDALAGDAFLAKPFKADALVEAVRSASPVRVPLVA